MLKRKVFLYNLKNKLLAPVPPPETQFVGTFYPAISPWLKTYRCFGRRTPVPLFEASFLGREWRNGVLKTRRLGGAPEGGYLRACPARQSCARRNDARRRTLLARSRLSVAVISQCNQAPRKSAFTSETLPHLSLSQRDHNVVSTWSTDSIGT